MIDSLPKPGTLIHRLRTECAKKAYKFLPVKVWPGQRIAASRAPNPTCREATNCMKLGGGRYQASTKVKVLSPEIYGVSEADSVP
jgi:hypothetical protein